VAALAAVAFLSVTAVAGDYDMPDQFDIHVDVEAEGEGIHYTNNIDVHVDRQDQTTTSIGHTKTIDVDVDDPADAPAITTDQTLVDEVIDPMGDYTNSVTLSVDADEVQGDPDGVNEKDGDTNIQENKDVVTLPDPAASSSTQNLSNNSFNPDPADSGSAVMHNAVEFDITSDAPITENIGVNAAAGAFNLQGNASIIAVGFGLLGQSQATYRQDTVSNAATLQDATNDIFSSIDLEDVTANVGINLVSGVGNAQLNSFTATTSFGP
jgi:hypothetical protein